MPDQPTPPVDPVARIAELEAKLARVAAERDLIAAERDMFKEAGGADPFGHDLDRTPTPEEVHELMHGPKSSVSLRDVIAEFERQPEGERS